MFRIDLQTKNGFHSTHGIGFFPREQFHCYFEFVGFSGVEHFIYRFALTTHVAIGCSL